MPPGTYQRIIKNPITVVDGELGKMCSKCERWMPVEKFGNVKSRHDGLSPWCKECHNDHAKQWRKDNPERAQETEMLWYQNNADHKKQYVREWRLENPNYGWEWVSSHPDECRETMARYRMNHPFERREASHLRRLAIKGVDAERFDYGEIFERDNWICGLCDRPI